MGEVLGEVFGLAAKEGESMKEWTARVGDTFERCKRKAAVDFAKEARGWIALHCASLTEEQKAIVKAKTQGALDLDTISAGIRSCFPQLKASGAKSRTYRRPRGGKGGFLRARDFQGCRDLR